MSIFTPTVQQLEATLVLTGAKEFDLFLKIIDSSIVALHTANVTAVGEQRSWNQGKLQALTDLLYITTDAQRLLHEIKNVNRQTPRKSPNI